MESLLTFPCGTNTTVKCTVLVRVSFLSHSYPLFHPPSLVLLPVWLHLCSPDADLSHV